MARQWRPQNSRPLRFLQETANYYLRIRDLDRTSAPADWHFRLLQLSFADLYFSEELDQVRNGFLRLCKVCRTPGLLDDLTTRN